MVWLAMKTAAAARMMGCCISRLGGLEVASLVACDILVPVTFLWGLMEEEREGWLSTGIYVARGSPARELLTIPCRHIDFPAQSPVMTPSYVLAVRKMSRLYKTCHLIGSSHTDLKLSRQPRPASRSTIKEMSLLDAHVLGIMLRMTFRISQSTVVGVLAPEDMHQCHVTITKRACRLCRGGIR